MKNTSEDPQWKPIEWLPVFENLIHEMLENAQDQYRNLLSVKQKSYVLADHTIERILELSTTQLQDHWLWEKQLSLWGELDLSSIQQKTVASLFKVAHEL